MMYLTAVLVILILWFLVSYLLWRKNIFNHVEKLPGVRRVPIFGTTYVFAGVPREEIFNTMCYEMEKYRPIFRTWSGSVPEVHLLKPEYVEIIMNNSVHITKGILYDSLLPWLGEGLLTSRGSRWFQHRKLITPTFHFKILENFMEVFVEKSQILLKLLESKADGKTFNIYPDITHCALDIICETAMGVPINSMSDKNNKYIKSVYSISEILLWRFLSPYVNNFIFKFLPQGRKFSEDLRVLHGFSKKVISDRKKQLKNKVQNETKPNDAEDEVLGKKKRSSFLDLLLEASNNNELLSDNDIREEVDTFMFEGHDTTTAGMCWVLFLLGNHPEIQEKAFEEVRYVLEDKPVPTSIAELQELKYLECVIKESLRLYPSVPFISRSLQQDIVIDGKKIPAGVQIILHIYGIHRSPEYYPNPNKFDPDRFLPENSLGRHPFAYIPFSAGPRNCIGQKFAMYEEKTILASIINKYKITAIESMENVKTSVDLILRPIDGILVKLEKRK